MTCDGLLKNTSSGLYFISMQTHLQPPVLFIFYAFDCQNARPATEPGCSVQSGLAAVKSSLMC